ncbi:hypothetical protein Zmor_023501 [Zophobas morio]|uniref:Uncharacterized protein n=1 Tax=Zophobas morio TaxID=2755281 RepID=A0AA38M7D9_9CUCU|nr:hypothetical protein Zmor_023501 [Zophobas morio]
MGQKHSKRPKKPTSQPEVTEIIELNDNQSELDDDSEIVSDPRQTEQIVYPLALKQVMDSVELIEKSIDVMTSSQMDLYYATLKDDLHNYWRRAYDLADNGDAAIKSKKIEAIERVKTALKRLNGKVLMNGHAVHN